MPTKKLYRSCQNKILGGVAGGLGDYFEIDPILIRLVIVLAALAGGIGILMYFIAWIIIPEDPACENGKPATEEMREKANEISSSIRRQHRDNPGSGRVVAGAVIAVIGILLLLQNIIGLDIFRDLWPAILIIIGLAIVFSATRK